MRKVARGGFTLPEVLVTIAIVATLAAVLLPALNNQLSKGDAGRLTSDLVAVQTAVGAFTSDVRRYPRLLVDLKTKPSATADDILNSDYTAQLVSKWRGPYLSKDLTNNDSLATGYGANIRGTFTSESYNGIQYLTISVRSLTEAEFNNIDQIIDETASSSTGQLRYAVSGTVGTATFYAIPIQ